MKRFVVFPYHLHEIAEKLLTFFQKQLDQQYQDTTVCLEFENKQDIFDFFLKCKTHESMFKKNDNSNFDNFEINNFSLNFEEDEESENLVYLHVKNKVHLNVLFFNYLYEAAIREKIAERKRLKAIVKQQKRLQEQKKLAKNTSPPSSPRKTTNTYKIEPEKIMEVLALVINIFEKFESNLPEDILKCKKTPPLLIGFDENTIEYLIFTKYTSFVLKSLNKNYIFRWEMLPQNETTHAPTPVSRHVILYPEFKEKIDLSVFNQAKEIVKNFLDKLILCSNTHDELIGKIPIKTLLQSYSQNINKILFEELSQDIENLPLYEKFFPLSKNNATQTNGEPKKKENGDNGDISQSGENSNPEKNAVMEPPLAPTGVKRSPLFPIQNAQARNNLGNKKKRKRKHRKIKVKRLIKTCKTIIKILNEYSNLSKDLIENGAQSGTISQPYPAKSFEFLFFKHHLNFLLKRNNPNFNFFIKDSTKKPGFEKTVEIEFSWNKNIAKKDYKNCFVNTKETFNNILATLKSYSSKSANKKTQKQKSKGPSLLEVKHFLFDILNEDYDNMHIFMPFFKEITTLTSMKKSKKTISSNVEQMMESEDTVLANQTRNNISKRNNSQHIIQKNSQQTHTETTQTITHSKNSQTKNKKKRKRKKIKPRRLIKTCNSILTILEGYEKLPDDLIKVGFRSGTIEKPYSSKSFAYLFFKHYLSFVLEKVNPEIVFKLKNRRSASKKSIEIEILWDRNIKISEYRACFSKVKESFQEMLTRFKAAVKPSSPSNIAQPQNTGNNPVSEIKLFLYDKLSKDSQNYSSIYKPFFKDVEKSKTMNNETNSKAIQSNNG